MQIRTFFFSRKSLCPNQRTDDKLRIVEIFTHLGEKNGHVHILHKAVINISPGNCLFDVRLAAPIPLSVEIYVKIYRRNVN